MRKGKGQLTYKQREDAVKRKLYEQKKEIEALHKTIAEKDVAINELISEINQLDTHLLVRTLILHAATPEELDTLVERAEKSLQDRYDKFWATHPELRTKKE